jgi:hypothetical protein
VQFASWAFTQRAKNSGLVPSMGVGRRLLRQRHDRGVLVAHAGRTPGPAPLEDPSGAGQRHPRRPGDLPQPTTPPQQPRHAHPDNIREHLHRGMRIQPPGSTKPGAQHSPQRPGELCTAPEYPVPPGGAASGSCSPHSPDQVPTSTALRR